MSDATSIAGEWHQYLQVLDEMLRQTELEMTAHLGSFEAVPDLAVKAPPDGSLPRECLAKAVEVQARMTSLASAIETQMHELTNHRASLARDTRSVFFDTLL